MKMAATTASAGILIYLFWALYTAWQEKNLKPKRVPVRSRSKRER